MKVAKIITVIFAVIALIALPVSLLITGFFTAPQYSLTYYGELSKMYDKLKNAKGEKIVIIGTSSVPFGVDSGLLEAELRAAGENRSVVNFGLYGALGTKVMLDLSREFISDGDIVIFAPELDEQPLSLYFSAKDMWYAADSDFSLLSGIAKDNIAEMVGNFPRYAAEKFEYIAKGRPAEPSGIYASASFDDNCDLKNARRDRNILSGGIDENSLINYYDGMISDEFVKYVNDYCCEISERGAVMVYSFAPMNVDAFSESPEKTIEAYYDFVSDNFDFEIISDPYDSALDKEWFYDSNFHLNSSGMTVHTVSLADDIKNFLGLSVPSTVVIPDKPLMSEEEETGDGDSELAELFVYAEDGDGLRIVAVAEGAELPAVVTVPYAYEEKRITSFDVSVFAGNTGIKEIYIQKNIKKLRDGSFEGCDSLRIIRLEQSDPSETSVGYGLLIGTKDCSVAVPEGSLGLYAGNYFWSYYAEELTTYPV